MANIGKERSRSDSQDAPIQPAWLCLPVCHIFLKSETNFYHPGQPLESVTVSVGAG